MRAGKGFKSTSAANFIANIVRNVWSNAIIFCGHFPDQTFMFTEEEVEDESRGAWYVRQMIGAANIDGGPFFHVLSGNLSFQVEHHLYPDMPSSRYQQIAPRVKEICEKYGLPYNTGPFRKQWGTVQRTILRLAFPGGGPRPKPGPYVDPGGGEEARASSRRRRCRHSREQDEDGQAAAAEFPGGHRPEGGPRPSAGAAPPAPADADVRAELAAQGAAGSPASCSSCPR